MSRLAASFAKPEFVVKLLEICRNFWNNSRWSEKIVFLCGASFLAFCGGREYSISQRSALPPLFQQAPSSVQIRVHIKGAVRKPSLLILPANARVHDALKRAQGATANADLESLNLAAPLQDEQQIVVPFRGVKSLSQAQATSQTPAASTDKRIININTASAQELETLPDIGPALAARIVAERARQPFRTLQELDRVKGIGAKKLQKLAPYVTF